jgi:hypothetical protein
MKTINDVLSSGALFEIDDIACMSHALKIKDYSPTETAEPWHVLPTELRLFLKVAFISICHQINWDYLQKTIYEKIALSHDDPLDLVSRITSKTIEEWLSDYPKKDRVRAKERAKLIRNVGQTINSNFKGDLKYFYMTLSESSLKNKEFELVMDNFEAYGQDPLKKKTNVLSHDICTEQIFKIKDEDYLQPAIDYHIMRIYLRTGRVVPKDKALFKYFTGTPNPRGTIISQLRNAVGEALRMTAHYSNLNIAQTNFIEWQLGRSICTNSEPACKNSREISLPNSISKLIRDRCPYIEECAANNLMMELINFEEPLYISTRY